MNILGVGPLLALTGGVSILVIVILKHLLGFNIIFDETVRNIFIIIGIIFSLIGIYFLFSSLFLVKRIYKTHELITFGVYRYSRNPMYSSFIVFLIPSIAFLSNNPLILIVSFIMFVVFKISIRKEEKFLNKEYGQEYQKYVKRVAQLIPFVKI
jgi:protein-S-isoprenylcysteine O-methyltransferase Ste14